MEINGGDEVASHEKKNDNDDNQVLEVASNANGEVVDDDNDVENIDDDNDESKHRTLTMCIKENKKLTCIFCSLVLMAILGATVLRGPIEQAVLWLNEQGGVGGFLFGLFHTVAILIGLPSTIFEIAAPIIFTDIWLVAIVVTISKNLSAAIAYVIGRYSTREWIDEYVRGSKALSIRGFMRAFKDKPIQIAFLWTASYTPSWLRNYMLAALECNFGLYMLSSFLVGIPYSVLWILVGLSIRDLIIESEEEVDGLTVGDETPVEQYIAIAFGIIFLVLGVAAIGYYTKKAVQRIEEEERALEASMVQENGTHVPSNNQKSGTVTPEEP